MKTGADSVTPNTPGRRARTEKDSGELQWNGEAWDRRSSPRLDLSYRLKLRRTAARDIEAETRNVSYSGFYFQTVAQMRPQEKVEYEMVMPWNPSQGSAQIEMVLRGFARVIRVDAAKPGTKSGVACRLEGEYTISQRDEQGSSLMNRLPLEAEAC